MPLDSHHLLEESVPIGGLLLAWYVLSAFVAVIASGSFLGTLSVGFRIVGSATAVVFVVYRGVAIARGTRPVRLSGDLRELLDESTVVAVPVLAWVVLATIVPLAFSVFGILPNFSVLVAAFVQTAVATAGLYVVARVVPVLRSGVGWVAPPLLATTDRVGWKRLPVRPHDGVRPIPERLPIDPMTRPLRTVAVAVRWRCGS